jgi:outer membrane protein assembly factor BamA
MPNIKHPSRITVCIRALLALLFLFSSLCSLNSSAQQPAPTAGPKIAKIEFVGLKRLSREQLLDACGLEIGQIATEEVLDAAAQRLMDSGLLRKLSYRLHTENNQATVTFQVEEGGGGVAPVIFDNFIWFTDEELNDAVRREVRTFDMTAPTAGNMPDAITLALQHFLNERKIAGTVEYMASENIVNKKLEHVFTVRGPVRPICSVHFPGAHNIEEDRLIKSAKPLLDTEYSRRLVAAFTFSNLFPFYRELGQLRATFSPSQAKAGTTANCKDGVDLTIGVDEGVIYSWDKPEWSGNQVLSSQELDAALSMKSGEVANGLKFDKGIANVRNAYGRKGYISAFVQPQAEYDDDARKVAYHLEVKEGPQYHMGTLTIKGFSDNLGNYLRGKWDLKAGDVFDQGYAEEFFKTTFPDVLRKVKEERQEEKRLPPTKSGSEERLNKSTLTVDVTIELVN